MPVFPHLYADPWSHNGLPTSRGFRSGALPPTRAYSHSFNVSHLWVSFFNIVICFIGIIGHIHSKIFTFYRNASEGLDGIYVDYALRHIITMVPRSVTKVYVRSDGFWCLPQPLVWQLPKGAEQWQPCIGPVDRDFYHALNVGPIMLVNSQSQPSPFQKQSQQQMQQQQQQQQPVPVNGQESGGQIPGKRSFGTMASSTLGDAAQNSVGSSQQRPANFNIGTLLNSDLFLLKRS